MSILVDIEKTLGSFHLKAKFEAKDETLALLGASGCGKSLTLKCIAGIEKPDRGKIIVDDVTLFDSNKNINLTPQQRRTGLMFQNYALFPNMTVLQNIQAGANREINKTKRTEVVTAIMDSFGLSKLWAHYPNQLSGGQQQRVALARILVSNPRILLLDEPFSALDSHLRFLLEQEVREVIRQFKKTVLLVSHDRDEVFRMSNSVGIMDHGSILVTGPKKVVFADPKTISGAVLTGCKNISRVEVLDENHVRALDWGITLRLAKPAKHIVAIGIRMHDVRIGTDENTFRCRVVEEIENPFSYTIMLKVEGANNTIPFGYELAKDTWNRIRTEVLDICLPKEAILLLGE